MKITSFSFTLRQADTKDGYGDNYYVNIDKDGDVNVSHPYKNIPHEEQAAILSVIQTGIIQYDMLAKECTRANKRLKLEEYAPVVSSEDTSEEEKAIAAAKLSAAQELEALAESSVLQPSRLGDGEVSTVIEDAPFEEVETAMDKAKTPEEMLKVMIASGERKEVRDLPM